jgi:putative transcriptional regulator
MENRLCELRTARGWTQRDLAQQLRVSRQTVISLERGRYDPSLVLAFRIAEAFDCTIEDIFMPQAHDEKLSNAAARTRR